MKIKFVKSAAEPRPIKICGKEYPALLSMSAMAEIEEQTGMPYGKFFDKMGRSEATAKEQVAMACACLRAGGTEVKAEDLMGLDLVVFGDVMNQLYDLVYAQMPEGDGKNPEA